MMLEHGCPEKLKLSEAVVKSVNAVYSAKTLKDKAQPALPNLNC